jgi:2-methylisocitrate lyase-like PEP mutase family enzyme
LTGRRRAFRVRHHHPAGIARHRAGADVLYAPGVRDMVSALGKPFNLVMGFADPTLTVDQLSAAGVKRISVGGAMSRFALAAFLKCAREMKDKGSFTYVREMAPIKDLRDAFAAVEG